MRPWERTGSGPWLDAAWYASISEDNGRSGRYDEEEEEDGQEGSI